MRSLKVWEALCRLLQWIASQILKCGPMPQHVAIIMDGNRRFADRAGMDRRSGHGFGYHSLIRTLQVCLGLGIKYMTVYAFSIDNFKRSSDEVSALMDLMREKLDSLVSNQGFASSEGIRVCILGDLSLLPEDVRASADRAMAATKDNTRAVLNICVAYTSTEEIVHAARESISEALWLDQDAVSLKSIERHLYTADCPWPELLIRTSGETRLSNFMLWQCGHSQLAFCDVLWPEFSFRHLFWILIDYQRHHSTLQKHASKACKIQ